MDTDLYDAGYRQGETDAREAWTSATNWTRSAVEIPRTTWAGRQVFLSGYAAGFRVYNSSIATA